MEFLKVQWVFFKDVFMMYAAPFILLYGVVMVLGELLRYMIVSASMNSEEYETLNELKFEEEYMNMIDQHYEDMA